MFRLLAATVFVVLLQTGASVAAEPDAATSAAIRANAEAFEAAWGKNDAGALAALWDVDGDLYEPSSFSARGRAAVEKFFAEGFDKGALKGSNNAVKVTRIQIVNAELAIVNWDTVMSGLKAADGTAVPDMKHHVTLVLVKKADKWLYAAARPVFAPKSE